MNYTYTPIYNKAVKPAREDFYDPAAQAGYGRSYNVSEELESRREYMTQPGSKDTAMLALLFFVLPVLGLLAILMKPMRWVFCAATAISLVALLGFRSFLPKSRAVTSLILVLLTGFSMFGALYQPRLSVADGGLTGTNTGSLGAAATNTPIASTNSALLTQPTQVPDTESAPPLAQVTEAEKRLVEFMELWRQGASADDFIPYTWEEWRAAHSGSLTAALFYLVSTHTSPIIDYTIDPPNIADYDTSATLRVTVQFGGANPVTRRYDALMHKDKDGAWFIDPSSFQVGVTVQEPTPTPNPNVSATPKATATVNPNMNLYYNTSNGKMYHTKKNCSTIGKEYTDKMSSFVYSKLNDTQYKKLKPCEVCGAPPRP
ncbi:MAG: hypothetical protein LBD16_07720 [Oscillospiraceae bacterium]|jgi:hypothetical protein|nr:hypothetical protein [Oscillospiraceae bacterium]